MAAVVYVSSTTNTEVGASSESIAPAGLAKGDAIEVTCTSAAGAWVNHAGGTAAVGGADNIYIPLSGSVSFLAKSDVLNAIREAGANAVVTVSVLGAP
jgi:hypothetical protein